MLSKSQKDDMNMRLPRAYIDFRLFFSFRLALGQLRFSFRFTIWVYSGSCPQHLSSAVVADNNSRNPLASSQHCIFSGLNTLQNNRQFRDTLQPFQILPAETGIDERRDGMGGSLVAAVLPAFFMIALHAADHGRLVAHVLRTR